MKFYVNIPIFFVILGDGQQRIVSQDVESQVHAAQSFWRRQSVGVSSVRDGTDHRLWGPHAEIMEPTENGTR